MAKSVMTTIDSQEEKPSEEEKKEIILNIEFYEKLNDEYEEAKLKGFLGTFEEYLAVRDYT